jgi:hypothetical protein
LSDIYSDALGPGIGERIKCPQFLSTLAFAATME